MGDYRSNLTIMQAAVLTGFILLITAGCSSMKLNDYDDTINLRENMPGPGILSTQKGDSVLKWKTDKNQLSEAPNHGVTEDKNEFELYKEWKKLRSQDENSDEYQDFLWWLEFKKFN